MTTDGHRKHMINQCFESYTNYHETDTTRWGQFEGNIRLHNSNI